MPQTNRRTLHLRFSYPFLLLIPAAVLGLLGVIGVTIHKSRLHAQQTEITARERDALKTVNMKQAQELIRWRADMQRLAAEVTEYEVEQNSLRDLETRVRGLLGGSGGPDVDRSASFRDNVEEVNSPVDVLGRLETVKEDRTKRSTTLLAAVSDLESHMANLAATPAGWPAAGYRTDGFGWRWDPFGRGRLFHEGVDIAGAEGSEISARASGVVIFSGWRSDGYGQTVIIDHGNGFRTLYAHTSLLLAQTGQSVSRGDVIARMGSTGHSTGPHVHYEVQIWGQPVDPTPYLE